MQGICLLNHINSRQAFSAATSCAIKMLVVNASDVDHVSKVFSLPPYVPPLANTGDKHLSPYSLSAEDPSGTSFACNKSKQKQMGNKRLLRLFVIKLAQCKYAAHERHQLGGYFESEHLGLHDAQWAGMSSHVVICCLFNFPTISISFDFTVS